MIVLTRTKEALLDRLRALAGGDGRIVARALYEANAAQERPAQERPPLSDVVRRILVLTREAPDA